MVEPTQKQLQELKACEIELLKAFLEVCRKLNLRYYLVGGTLLGAVRHQGFIPWDDDIDLAMPREDYEVFLREGQKYLPEYYFLQSLYSEPAYHLNFAKIRDSRTTFVEYAVRNRNINHGVFIDVFPLDAYPEEEKARAAMDRFQQVFKYRLRSEVEIPEASRHGAVTELGLRAVSGLTKLRYPSYRKALEVRERMHKNASGGTVWANYCGAWGKKEIMPADWYAEGVSLTFEGLTVMGPKHYDKWLTQVYGDYMQLPPVEKRVGHHYTEAINLDAPYTDYLNAK